MKHISDRFTGTTLLSFYINRGKMLASSVEVRWIRTVTMNFNFQLLLIWGVRCDVWRCHVEVAVNMNILTVSVSLWVLVLPSLSSFLHNIDQLSTRSKLWWITQWLDHQRTVINYQIFLQVSLLDTLWSCRQGPTTAPWSGRWTIGVKNTKRL